MRERLILVIGLLVIAGVLALVFRERVAALTGPQIASIVYAMMALMLVGGGYMAGRSGVIGPSALRDALIWTAIIVALAFGYGAAAPYLPRGFGMN